MCVCLYEWIVRLVSWSRRFIEKKRRCQLLSSYLCEQTGHRMPERISIDCIRVWGCVSESKCKRLLNRCVGSTALKRDAMHNVHRLVYLFPDRMMLRPILRQYAKRKKEYACYMKLFRWRLSTKRSVFIRCNIFRNVYFVLVYFLSSMARSFVYPLLAHFLCFLVSICNAPQYMNKMIFWAATYLSYSFSLLAFVCCSTISFLH